MYAPKTLILAAFAFLVNLVVATPPACLLAALQVQPNPADVTNLCGSLQRQLEGNITQVCGTAASSVLNLYSSTCKAKGFTVTLPTSTSSSKTGSATATTTGSSSGSSSTGSGSSGSAGSATTGGSASGSGSAATASATGKSGASALSTQSPLMVMSLFMGTVLAGVFLL